MTDDANDLRPLRWGVLGTGFMPQHESVRSINSAGSSEVVAVLSSRQERADEFAAEFGIPHAYDSLERMLAETQLDAVMVSTTNELHKPQTLAAAAAGKHVLCEKPLATSLADAVEMVKACRDAGVLLGTNHFRRSKTSIQRVRSLIATGAIGDPLYARATTAGYLGAGQQTWRLDEEDGGGVILDVMVHDIDLLRYVLDDHVTEVQAVATRSGLLAGHLADLATSTMTFANGAIGSSTVSYCTPGGVASLEVLGSSGSILARDVLDERLGGEIEVRREGRLIERITLSDEVDHFVDAIVQFNAAIRGAGVPATSGADGVHSMAVAIAAAESVKSGCAVAVPDVAAALAGA